MSYRRILWCALLILGWRLEGAYDPYCDSLNEQQTHVYENAAKAFHLPQCANIPLAQRQSDTNACPLAPRLSAFACWLAHLNRDSSFIARELAQRYESFTSQRRFSIKKELFEPAGDKEAPVTIAVYISISCPFCKEISCMLYDSVITGSLNGKACLCLKLLSASDRDMALMAAQGCGKFWPYLKLLAETEQRLDMEVLLDAARKLDMPMRAFKGYTENPSVRARAVASREEGLRNGVTATPTIFINGREYRSLHKPEWIIDAVLYEYEGMRSTQIRQ